MNINEEVLEKVSGGRPVGRDGKPISASEYKKLRENDGIHVTSGTFYFPDPSAAFTSTYEDGIHVTSASF